ncbi:MAG TPA: hypothetical protein VMF91_25845 [Bryobacteraceae bacterium]|nr:hypothetical protein [Bryobacteraceae bacterium]
MKRSQKSSFGRASAKCVGLPIYILGFLVLVALFVCCGCEAAGAGAMEAGVAEGAGAGEAAGAAGEAAAGGEMGLRGGGATAEAGELGSRGARVVDAGRLGETEAGARAPEPGVWHKFGEARGPMTEARNAEARPSSAEGPWARQINTYTVRVRGAQPLDGITRHFDREGTYRGYSVHQADVSVHYDEAGRFDGRTFHRSDGSMAYDARGVFKGRSYDTGNITKVYDAAGRFKGINMRHGAKIYYYDAANTYTGYSVIEPPNGSRILIVPAGPTCDQQNNARGCPNQSGTLPLSR